MTKKLIVNFIAILLFVAILSGAVSADSHGPVIHTSPVGPLTIAEGDILEMDVTFSDMVGSLARFEYSLYDASGTLLQGESYTYFPGGGSGGGSRLSEELPLSWSSSSGFLFAPHYGSAALSPYTLEIHIVDDMSTPDGSDDLSAELVVPIVITDVDVGIRIIADRSEAIIVAEGESAELNIIFSDFVGSVYYLSNSNPGFMGTGGDSDTSRLYRFYPSYSDAEFSPYEFRVTGYDDMGTPDDRSDDEFASFSIPIIVTDVERPVITITTDPSGPIVIAEGEVLEIDFEARNSFGYASDFEFTPSSIGLVTLSDDDETGDTIYVTLRVEPGYGAAELGLTQLTFTTFERQGGGSWRSVPLIATVKTIPITITPADPPADSFEMTVNPSGPIIVTEGESAEITITYSGLVGSIRDQGFINLQRSKETDLPNIRKGVETDTNITYHVEPDFDDEILSPYNARFYMSDDMGTPSDESDDVVKFLAIPIIVVDAELPRSFLEETEVVANPTGPITISEGGTFDLTFRFTNPERSINGYGYKILPSTEEFNIFDNLAVVDETNEYVRFQFTPGFDAAGSYDFKFTGVSHTTEYYYDDVYSSVVVPITIVEETAPPRLDIGQLPVIIGHGETLDVEVTALDFVGDIRGINVSGDASSFMEKTDVENGTTLHFSPGFIDVGDYDLTINMTDDMGTPLDVSDDVDIVESIAITVSEFRIHTNPSGPIIFAENDRMQVDIFLGDNAGTLRSRIGREIETIYDTIELLSSIDRLSPLMYAIAKLGYHGYGNGYEFLPGYLGGTAALSPYELVVTAVRDTESSDPLEEISTFTIPIVITDPIYSTELEINANLSEPVTVFEGETKDISFTFSDAVGSVSGYGYHISPSSPDFNVMDVTVIEETETGMVLRFSPREGSAEDGPYTITVNAIDDMGTKKTRGLNDDKVSSTTIPITVLPPTSDISLRSMELNPDRLSCNEGQNGASVTVDIELENTGSADEDDARVLIRNSDLGIDITERNIEVDAGDRESLRYSFSVPSGTGSGRYEIDVKAYVGSDVVASEDVTLFVSSCTSSSSGRTRSISRSSGSPSVSSFTPTTSSSTSTQVSATDEASTTTSSTSTESEEQSEELSLPLKGVQVDPPKSRGFLSFITGRAVTSGTPIDGERNILVPLVILAGLLWFAAVLLTGGVIIRMR